MRLHVTHLALHDICIGVFIKFFTSLFFFLFFFGCSAFIQQQTPDSRVQEHQVRSEQIRRIMHDLDNALYIQNKSEIERDDERRVMLLSLSAQIEQMSLKMRHLMDEGNITACDKDRNTFDTYAQALEEQGAKMRSVAENYAFEQLDSLMQETRRLCVRCHRSFCVDAAIREID